MAFVEGKFKKIIYDNKANYYVALFKVSKSSIKELNNKTITVTGIVIDLKLNFTYHLEGEYLYNKKYAWQFDIASYQLIMPSKEEEIINFLASPFIDGCTKELAKNIVNMYGKNTLETIKNDYQKLLKVKKITDEKAMRIYSSIWHFSINETYVNNLKNLGFSFDDASKILNNHYEQIDEILKGNVYLLKDLFDFKKLDDIYINNFDVFSTLRIKECFLNSALNYSFNEGSTYFFIEDILPYLKSLYNISLDIDKLNECLDILIEENELLKIDKRYYLKKLYEDEKNISKFLYDISQNKIKKYSNFNKDIISLEEKNKIEYNEDQIKAIKNALENSFSIISGGPGTGKTTIIKAITLLYMKQNKLTLDMAYKDIALLAPTGRAAKKLSEATSLPAYTIHRFLGWHKEGDYFTYNMDNKVASKFIVIDEASMLDVSLLASLFQALNSNVRIVLVGDVFQLPSVGPGLVLNDLINSDLFCYVLLSAIYRQSDNSYIPYLAKDIKNCDVNEDYMYKRDDYSFIVSENDKIVKTIIEMVQIGLNKGLNENNLQVLCPMYKGINGIDNLNIELQKIFNPVNDKLNEIVFNKKVYREKDKVLQLVNDSEKNVFNGDIGQIQRIYEKNKKPFIDIVFDSGIVQYEKKELKNISLAYAISIHKAQGSEFDNVIIPLCSDYFIMLYNKLLYTAVSRAKKSLTLVGDPRSFTTAVYNNYSKNRKTALLENLKNDFNV